MIEYTIVDSELSGVGIIRKTFYCVKDINHYRILCFLNRILYFSLHLWILFNNVLVVPVKEQTNLSGFVDKIIKRKEVNRFS